MTKLMDTLTGTKVLEERQSAINGKLKVVKDIAWGTYIKADGLTQSGGVVKTVWVSTFKKVAKLQSGNIKSCLILGLGGGTIARLVAKRWPEAKITGVDLDPEIVDLGKKYLGLDELNLEIVIADGIEYCKKAIKAKQSFDLILIDMYQGSTLPQEFDNPEFATMISALLNPDGIAIFNRLFYGEKRLGAYRFLRTLEKVFLNVYPIYPEANVMLLCKTM